MNRTKRHRSIAGYVLLLFLLLSVFWISHTVESTDAGEKTAAKAEHAVQTEHEEKAEDKTDDESDEALPVMETVSGTRLPYTECLTLEATAYSGAGQTASGTMTQEGVVAVDPDVIPLGTKLYIMAEDGESWAYGYAVAEDTGSAIQGDRIDLFYESESDCEAFGRQMVKAYLLAE